MKRLSPLLLLTLATLAATLTGCAGGPSDHGDDGHGKAVPVARATGAPLHCLSIPSISESRVQDDWTIDFRTGVRQWYRVTLPQRCNSLGTYRAFKYETSLSQLCNTDIITVMEFGGPGGGPRGSCGMGDFQPVEIAPQH